MTLDSVGTAGARPQLSAPEDLKGLMGIDFSDQQMAAITAPLEPGVIVAGAGSGKTTVMAARVVWLVGTGAVRAEEVLGLTFTNKAAAELAHRVRDFLATAGLTPSPADQRAEVADAEDIGEPTVLTYHAYAARLLAEHGLRIGHEPDTQVMADASRYQLAARAVRCHTEPVQHLSTWLATSVNGLLNLDTQLCEHLVSIEELRDFQRREAPRWREAKQTKEVEKVVTAFDKRQELLAFVEGYRRLKAELGVMDFADQMARSAQLAEQCPEVGAAERERFRVVLLDEYQDTSIAQARLLQGLFSGGDPAAGRGHPVTAVGDPCQAIYGWRGASVSNIERFPTTFPRADGAQVRRFPLSVNRRSTSRVLQTANRVAAPLYEQFTGVAALEPVAGAQQGLVRASVWETYREEMRHLAAEVRTAYDAMAVPKWSEIAVLVRDNKNAREAYDALAHVGIPVEIVGLGGLLQMPEVVEVLSTLHVLHDVTANASLLTLLAGPRWAVGPRDLALLGQRARDLARSETVEADDIDTQLTDAVAGVDPADVVSLSEALDDPDGAPYSSEARERFRMLAQELRSLRRYVGEPLLDLVRRVVEVSGIDVELASSTSDVAAARRANLDAFCEAVSRFAGIDGDASLQGLLAYLNAEEDYGQGLELAIPTEANSVKLLTVHRAKGLEWDVVLLPAMSQKVFPSDRGRSKWTSTPGELPWPLRGDAADLPQVEEASSKGLKGFGEECKEYSLDEERRLGYVAVTRPRRELAVSSHWWGPEQKRPRGPSELADEVAAAVRSWGEQVDPETEEPAADAENPVNRTLQRHAWPVEASADEVAAREAAAALVATAQAAGWQNAAQRADDQLMLDEQAEVAQWDAELTRLVEEARADRADHVVVDLPAVMSATTMLRLHNDPDGLARDLARPMPRKPSSSARFGTRFHAWVEGYVGQQQLLDPADLPGRADEGIEGDAELRELTEAFKAGPFGDRPPYQVEAPFAVVLAGQVVRGRIDAVYQTASGYQVVDWKTNRDQSADPLQLAIYRVAWAELAGVDVTAVEAAFYYVRSAEVVAYPDLPGRAELERIIVSAS